MTTFDDPSTTADAAARHVRQMVRQRDFAPNSTAVLAINFGVPLFLGLAYLAWV